VKYMLLTYANQETWARFTPEEQARAIAEQDAVNGELFGTGELVGAYGLADAAMAGRTRREACGLNPSGRSSKM
jgi:hypothetical protein